MFKKVNPFFALFLTGRMWSAVLRANSLKTCRGLCMRWSAGWWSPWSTARSLCPETSRGKRPIDTFKPRFLLNSVNPNNVLHSSAVTLGLSALPAPTRRPQASSIPWRGASSTSTSPPCTCASRRSPASTSPEEPPQHGPLTLRSRQSREISSLSAALRGEDCSSVFLFRSFFNHI